jgi:putative hemolysin
MSSVVLQIAIIVVLVLLNGFFAMSETALVSSRKARLRQRAQEGDRGARTALQLADAPNRFLSTVQIGISLIGVLAGAFGGATLAEPLADALRAVPLVAPYAAPSLSAPWWSRSPTSRSSSASWCPSVSP